MRCFSEASLRRCILNLPQTTGSTFWYLSFIMRLRRKYSSEIHWNVTSQTGVKREFRVRIDVTDSLELGYVMTFLSRVCISKTAPDNYQRFLKGLSQRPNRAWYGKAWNDFHGVPITVRNWDNVNRFKYIIIRWNVKINLRYLTIWLITDV